MKKQYFLILLLLAFTLTGCPHSNGTDTPETPAVPETPVTPANTSTCELAGNTYSRYEDGYNSLWNETWVYSFGNDKLTFTYRYEDTYGDTGIQSSETVFSYTFNTEKQELYLTVDKVSDGTINKYLCSAGEIEEGEMFYFTPETSNTAEISQKIAQLYESYKNVTLEVFNDWNDTSYISWAEAAEGELLAPIAKEFRKILIVKYTLDDDKLTFNSILPPEATAEKFLNGLYSTTTGAFPSFYFEESHELIDFIISATDSEITCYGSEYSYTADFSSDPKTVTIILDEGDLSTYTITSETSEMFTKQ
ncbi:MAG: hypothetical protein KBT02_02435 [Treponema sp.]|nr:hypothetical protein [Candidatus Treponema caballi]